MRKFILDSSICFDLFNAALLELALKLPYAFLIPDVIVEEELIEPSGEELINLGYQRSVLTSKEIETVISYAVKYPKPSRNDIFALTCAKTQGITLLTGDRDLRKSAEEEKIEVHGLIWLLDEMLKHKLFTSNAAADALETILANGSRLPKHECDERLKRWREV